MAGIVGRVAQAAYRRCIPLLQFALWEPIERNRMLAAEPLALRARGLPAGTPLAQVEFRVFSQWGEDGILQHLLAHVPVSNPVFVEFGVHNYLESNTRYLLQRGGWSGLVMDGDAGNVRVIRTLDLSWRYGLKSRAAFVTRENINALLREEGLEGDIGLLSVDIDGNDYWVWEAIRSVSPRIVVAEYNSLFGPRAAVTVPYDPAFERHKMHPSGAYFGASLAALRRLALSKGYRFVGVCSAGINAFFVREDCAGALAAPGPGEGFVASRSRDSRGDDGGLDFADAAVLLERLAGLPLVDVESGKTILVRDLGGLASLKA